MHVEYTIQRGELWRTLEHQYFDFEQGELVARYSARKDCSIALVIAMRLMFFVPLEHEASHRFFDIIEVAQALVEDSRIPVIV